MNIMMSVVGGQMNATDSTNPEGQQPQGPTKRMNWAQRHPGWILLLVIIGSPFVIYGIVVGVGMLLVRFAPSSSSVADAAFTGAIAFTPVLYIMIIVFGVRWYKARKRE